MSDKRISIASLRLRQKSNWPSMYEATHPAVLRILRASDIFMGQTAQSLKHLQLSHAEFDALATIRAQPAPYQISPTELCKTLLISSGGLTKLLYRLEAAGYITRPPSSEDRRSLLVQLSPKGKEIIESLVGPTKTLHTERLRNLTSEEQQQLDNLLDKVLADYES
ncbi:Multiple antibiotic resistance protein MarR [Zhongshania aliphaticivorans]|uniref:Multiple antibiotic resistance protein MarR n=1 Tax=Zhongshania aliphaticivorans TaxID=1470434 RepID=A0A5S9MPX9_9GAMM|nr:MarR family transcriptional regulator [Zhongshania aliphaticivorans]CAA0079091.1 Multiple antibiotic resistance protein MarR [Zhongshania aliphaticivorans]CAA0086369.1 Multiple antibiotic resistance protein MarR [Zhongshania aliphaticivorans]